MRPGIQSQPAPECGHAFCHHKAEYVVSDGIALSAPAFDKYACSSHLKEVIDRVLGPGPSGRSGQLTSISGSTTKTKTATVKRVLPAGAVESATGRFGVPVQAVRLTGSGTPGIARFSTLPAWIVPVGGVSAGRSPTAIVSSAGSSSSCSTLVPTPAKGSSRRSSTCLSATTWLV